MRIWKLLLAFVCTVPLSYSENRRAEILVEGVAEVRTELSKMELKIAEEKAKLEQIENNIKTDVMNFSSSPLDKEKDVQDIKKDVTRIKGDLFEVEERVNQLVSEETGRPKNSEKTEELKNEISSKVQEAKGLLNQIVDSVSSIELESRKEAVSPSKNEQNFLNLKKEDIPQEQIIEKLQENSSNQEAIQQKIQNSQEETVEDMLDTASNTQDISQVEETTDVGAASVPNEQVEVQNLQEEMTVKEDGADNVQNISEREQGVAESEAIPGGSGETDTTLASNQSGEPSEEENNAEREVIQENENAEDITSN
jgi:hypothetical protein